MPRRCKSSSICRYRSSALSEKQFSCGSTRLHSTDNRKDLIPSFCARSKSTSVLVHQSQAEPHASRDRMCPAFSQSDHWLSLPPSTWCAAVETPHKKPLGNLRKVPFSLG